MAMNGKTTPNRRWKYHNSKGGTKWQEKNFFDNILAQ